MQRKRGELERQHGLRCRVATKTQRHTDMVWKRVLTRVKTSHRGRGGHGLARHSGTCDWRFLEIRVFLRWEWLRQDTSFTKLRLRRCFGSAPRWRNQRTNDDSRRRQRPRGGGKKKTGGPGRTWAVAEPRQGRSKHLWSVLCVVIKLTWV